MRRLSRGFSSLLQLSATFNSPSYPSIIYRVPNTHTILRISVRDAPIQAFDLCRTITYTRQVLRSFIEEYHASDTGLTVPDDPYESPRILTGCSFGVATVPPDAHHLTYGIVDEVLQGLFNYLFRAERHREAIFEVFNDRFGQVRTVGIGKITPGRLPGLNVERDICGDTEM